MSTVARHLSTAAVTAGLVVTGAGVAQADPVRPDPAVPDTCYASLVEYSKNGARTDYSLEEGVFVESLRTREPRLDPAPIAGQYAGAAGDVGYFNQRTLMLGPDGTLSALFRVGTLTGKRWDVTHEITPLETGWTDTTDIVLAFTRDAQLYRVIDDGSIIRYAYDGAGNSVISPTAVGSLGDGVQTVSYHHSVEGNDGAVVADVLWVTYDDGQLVEVTIERTEGATLTSLTLATSGWSGLTALDVDFCLVGDDAVVGGVFTTVTERGEAYIYVDPDPQDGSIDDLLGGTTLVARNLRGVVLD